MNAPERVTLDDWLRWLETLHPKKIDLSLDRIRRVLDELGLSTPSYRIIAVAGTNGKGSCVALLESVYREAGYRVGAFTSPHLWRFNERIRIDGVDSSDETILASFEAIERARAEITLSYFEYSTLAALLQFEREGAEVALLEVGLGGRLDAVNAVDPDAGLIVSVALDHQEWLGSTREAIGHEKAGIMRPNRTTVVCDRDPPDSVMAHAERIGASVRRLGGDFDFGPGDAGWSYRSETGGRGEFPLPALGGSHQLQNAAGCVAIVEVMQDQLPVGEAALARGIEAASLRGRIERRTIAGVEWIFDVAHNPAAAANLAAELEREERVRTLAVVGMMGDKDIGGVLSSLVPLVDEWLLTRAGGDRSADPATLASVLRSDRVVHQYLDVAEACEDARLRAVRGDRVVVFGSFYLVGPALSALGLYSAPSQSGDVSAKWTGV